MTKIRVADLRPNPFRKLDAYPLRDDKVTALKESIRSTDFWDNLIVRRAPDGDGFELAFGHHRWKALKELRIEEIDVPVRKLDDETMLRMMAHENRQEWGASAAVEQETIRSVVEAYALGSIELSRPDKKTNQNKLRYAPYFVCGNAATDRGSMAYTAETVQKFLGFKGDAGLNRINDTLNALAMIEQGVLRKEDVADLTVYKVKLVQQAAKEYEHAPEVQKKVAREIAKKLTGREITGFDKQRSTQVRLEASRIAHAHNVKSKSELKAAERGEKVRTQDDEALKLAADIDMATQYGQVFKRVSVLTEFAEFCSPSARKKLVTSLTKLRDHLDNLIGKIEAKAKEAA